MTEARAAFAVRSIGNDALDDVVIGETATIAEATAAFDRGGEGVVVVCDAQGVPTACITDAEIRDGLLRRLDGSQPATLIASSAFDVTRAADAPASTVERLRDGGQTVSVRVGDDGRPAEVRVLVAAEDVAPLSALVLAGGLGLRMRPLTEERPKPLIKVAGKPMIDHVLEHLARHRASEVTIATNYLAEKIEAHVGDGSRFGLAIRFLREKKRMGTAGALSLLDPRPARPILVVNADVITRLDLRALEQHHRRTGAAMTLAVHPYVVEVPYGVTRLVGSRVVEIREKPRLVHWANAGLYVVSPSVIAEVPRETYVDMTTLIDRLVARGDLVEAFPMRESWHDTGTPADVERASRDLST